MKRVKIGVVGLGGRGSGFVQNFRQYPDFVEVVGAYDRNMSRMKALAKLGGYEDMPLHERWEDFVAGAKYDLVLVTTSDDAHPEFVVKSLDAGLNVFCDKPLANTAEGLLNVMEAYDRNDQMLLMGFNLRYHNYHRKLKEIAQRGELGKVLVGLCNHVTRGIKYFRRWHKLRARSGGLVLHKGCHQIDILNWVIGSYPVEVYAQGDLTVYKGDKKVEGCHVCDELPHCPYARKLSFEQAKRHHDIYVGPSKVDGYACNYCPISPGEGVVPDFYLVTIRYANGARATYNEVLFSGRAQTDWNFFGDKAEITNGPNDTIQRVEHLSGEVATYDSPKAVGGHGGADPVMSLDLVMSVAQGKPRTASPEAGARSSAVGIAAMKSIDEGRPVQIEEIIPIDYLKRNPDADLNKDLFAEQLGYQAAMEGAAGRAEGDVTGTNGVFNVVPDHAS